MTKRKHSRRRRKCWDLSKEAEKKLALNGRRAQLDFGVGNEVIKSGYVQKRRKNFSFQFFASENRVTVKSGWIRQRPPQHQRSLDRQNDDAERLLFVFLCTRRQPESQFQNGVRGTSCENVYIPEFIIISATRFTYILLGKINIHQFFYSLIPVLWIQCV